MSESNINVTPGTGGPNIDLEIVDNSNARQVVCLGDPITSANVAKVSAAGNALVDGSTVTQPISVASLPLPSGAATAVLQTTISGNQTNGTQQTQIVQGGNAAIVDSTGDVQTDVNNQVQTRPSDQCQSITAATGVGVTVTLPAVAAQFHYITLIEIHKYFTVANTASATPLIVTTTNLPGSLAFTFGQPTGAIGVTDERVYPMDSPLKSSAANTVTTIICPATTGVIWRVNVFYYTAA